MSIIIKILIIIALGVITMFFIKKFIESIFNLIASREKNSYDLSRQREGIVLNKDTKRLEADQSLILPF